MAGIANLNGLSVGRGGCEADIEIVLHLVPKPLEEADEDDDLENNEHPACTSLMRNRARLENAACLVKCCQAAGPRV